MSNIPSDMFTGSSASKPKAECRFDKNMQGVPKLLAKLEQPMSDQKSSQNPDFDQVTVLQKELTISEEVIER